MMKEARRHQVLSRLLADAARGELQELRHYAVIFPDDPELLTEEYLAISSGPELFDAPVLRHYEIIRELGRGGQAVVYLAHDQRLDREVALKVLTGTSLNAERRLARFQREAQVASKLDHPHICPIFETGMEGATAFMSMRFLKGGSLKQLLDRAQRAADDGDAKAWPSAEACDELIFILEKVARAVHAAHEVGIVHRDIKPGNIMLNEDFEPFVVDFGLALGAREEESALTQTGDFLGTPAYMPPERLRDDGSPIDRRVDVWALGVILFEIMAGKRPFGGPTQAEIQRRICEEEPPLLRRFHPQCPRDLEIIVETALSKDLNSRYATALDLAEDLRRHRELVPIRARRRGAFLRLRRWGQRNPVVALFLPALLVILSLALIMTDDALKRSREQGALLEVIESERQFAEDLDRASFLLLGGRRDEADKILEQLKSLGFEVLWCRALGGSLVSSEPEVQAMPALKFYLKSESERVAAQELARIESLEKAIISSDRPRYLLHRLLLDAYLQEGRKNEAQDLEKTLKELWPQLER